MTANARHTYSSIATANQAGAVPVMFLPGIVMLAARRYAPLIKELGDSTRAVTKELEVYAAATPRAALPTTDQGDSL